MLPLDIVLPFIVASGLLALVPGPDNIFVLTQSAVNGRLAGIVITLGLCSGLLFHTSLVAFGVAIVFQQSVLAFNILKFAGALYLLYLAWQMFYSDEERLQTLSANSVQFGKLYVRGIIMNVTNPKVSIFFLAFLPQFASVNYGSLLPQIFFLGFVFFFVALVVFSTIAVAAGYLSETLKRSSRAQSVLNKIAGSVFIGLALKLALTER